MTRDELMIELLRLRAIVEKLPKTADGMPVVPGLRLWMAFRDGIFAGHATGAGGNGRIEVRYDSPIDLTEGGKVMTDVSEPVASVCFTTEAAARAAMEKP